MRLFTVAAVLVLVTPAFSYTGKYNVTYSRSYDDGQNSLKNVACSTGEYGLLTRGYTNFDSLPTFPYIAATPQIRPQNLRYCGTCWELTYTDHQGVSTSLNITAIDSAGDHDGFVLSSEGWDVLANGRPESIGRVSVTATQVRKSGCGL